MNSFNEPFTDNDPVTLYFGGTVIFLLVTFVLLMPILLMNLLVTLIEPHLGETNNVVCKQVLHKLSCTGAEYSQRLAILDLESRGIVLSV